MTQSLLIYYKTVCICFFVTTNEILFNLHLQLSIKRNSLFLQLGICYVNPQERKPQAQRDWLDLLQGRAHNVHKVNVCALSLLRQGIPQHFALTLNFTDSALLLSQTSHMKNMGFSHNHTALSNKYHQAADFCSALRIYSGSLLTKSCAITCSCSSVA